jgi:spore coat protein U-like protein
MEDHRHESVFYFVKHIGFFTAFLGFSVFFAPASVATPAPENTANNTLTVTASINSSCSVSAATLAFGVYAPESGSAVSGSTDIPVTCTAGTNFQLGLNTGSHSGNGTGSTTRAMKGSGGLYYLSYELYQDISHHTVWGNTIVTEPTARSGTGSAINLTVYGQIPANQTTAPPDSYADSVTATVTY